MSPQNAPWDNTIVVSTNSSSVQEKQIEQPELTTKPVLVGSTNPSTAADVSKRLYGQGKPFRTYIVGDIKHDSSRENK